MEMRPQSPLFSRISTRSPYFRLPTRSPSVPAELRIFSSWVLTMPLATVVVLPLPAVLLLLPVVVVVVLPPVVVPVVLTYSILIQPLSVRPQPSLVSRIVTTSPLK